MVVIEAHRTGYAPSQVANTLTVGELIEILQQYEEDQEVIISHDEGYIFGGINEEDIEERDEEDYE